MFFPNYSGVKTENTQSAKKWLNFNFQGGLGWGWLGTLESKLKMGVKTENTQSAKKWLNFNLGGWGVGGGGGVKTENTQKCQEMAKFQFPGGGGEGLGVVGYSGVKTENTQSGKKWLNFNLGGGVLWSQNWKYSKCQEMAKFQWGGV